MDPIKESFNRVKQDIDYLYYEINTFKKEIELINSSLNNFESQFNNLNEKIDKLIEKSSHNTSTHSSTHRQINKTDSTHSSTNNTFFKPLNDQNLGISTGNKGVPTDRQTNQQTNQHTQNSGFLVNPFIKTEFKQNFTSPQTINNAANILESLDNIKKEIRLKFKRLTDQEFLVFSTLYQIEEECGYSDYATISNKIGLTQSSIRDYVGRLIKKGIPVEKIKINNKNIQLKVSENLKKVVSLPTILQLRDL